MKILVLGKGIANDGVVSLLNHKGLDYTYLNQNEVKDLDFDLIIKAPGIPYSDEIVCQALNKNIKIITDIELAMMLHRAFYIGVTGSNGKTTTVKMLQKILARRYKTVACGNIGYSVGQAVVDNQEADIFIVELSSFQLERSAIDLDIAVILNVNPCHLDHHSSFKDYLESKTKIFENQSKSHLVIYNAEDPYLKEQIGKALSRKVSFSTSSLFTTCSVYRNNLYYKNSKIMALNSKYRQKEFLTADALAAASVALNLPKIRVRDIKKALLNFEEVDYRMIGVRSYIYNDAKSTNPYSTIAAIKCFSEVSLICGGYDRKENLECLIDYLPYLKRVYTFGKTKTKVEDFMHKHGVFCLTFPDLESAFLKALELRDEEVILFSPMFASFDCFKNYLERGRYFNELVEKYVENEK